MTQADLLLGWSWGGNNQLAFYELWKQTLSRLVHDCEQIPCPVFLALWCAGPVKLHDGFADQVLVSRDIQIPLRGMRDALDFRLQRDPLLLEARRFAATMGTGPAAHAHAFILEKLRHGLGLPFVDCEPADLRALPAWMPATGTFSAGMVDRAIAWMQTTTSALEHASGLFQRADLQLLKLGLAHLSASERIIALEVLAAIRWFDLNRRQGPTLSGIGESVAVQVSSHADDHPTGGIDSISHRGPWENLVPSELAYLDESWPSLFEIRWLNRELLFYGRDEAVHRRPILDWWIRVDPRVGDWLEQPQDSPYRQASMALGWALSLVLRLRKSFGDWDFRIWLERLTTTREIRPGHRSNEHGFLSFLDPFARRLGFELGAPGAIPAEVALGRHKLILMELGSHSEAALSHRRLVLGPPEGVIPPAEVLCWDHPQSAAEWLELDERIMERLPTQCLQGVGIK